MITSCKYELMQSGTYVIWGLSVGHADIIGDGSQISIVFDSDTFSMIAHGIKDVVDDVMKRQRERWRKSGMTPMNIVQVTFPERWPVDEINEIMSARTQKELQPLLKKLLDRATTFALAETNEQIQQDPSRSALHALEGHRSHVPISAARVVQDQEDPTAQGQDGRQIGATEEV